MAELTADNLIVARAKAMLAQIAEQEAHPKVKEAAVQGL